MANVNMIKDAEKCREEVKAAKLKLQRFEQQQRRLCNHRNVGKLESVKETRRYIPDKGKYPETAVVCPNCGEIFDLNVIDQKDVEELFFKMDSMLNQIQLISDLNDDEKDRIITDGFESLDKLRTFGIYYNDMVRKLREGNKGNNRSNKSGKGGIGISNSMFGR